MSIWSRDRKPDHWQDTNVEQSSESVKISEMFSVSSLIIFLHGL